MTLKQWLHPARNWLKNDVFLKAAVKHKKSSRRNDEKIFRCVSWGFLNSNVKFSNARKPFGLFLPPTAGVLVYRARHTTPGLPWAWLLSQARARCRGGRLQICLAAASTKACCRRSPSCGPWMSPALQLPPWPALQVSSDLLGQSMSAHRWHFFFRPTPCMMMLRVPKSSISG